MEQKETKYSKYKYHVCGVGLSNGDTSNIVDASGSQNFMMTAKVPNRKDFKMAPASCFVRSIFIGMLEPENILFAFGILLLSLLQAEQRGSFNICKNILFEADQGRVLHFFYLRDSQR